MLGVKFRSVILILVLGLFFGVARAQDPTPPPQKKIPSMSTDDVDGKNQSGLTTISQPEAKPPAEKPSAVMTPEGWARYSPDECGLSIALPGKPQAMDLPSSGKTQATAKNYVYTDGKVVVMATHAVSEIESSTQTQAEAFFQGLGATPKISGMKSSIEQGTGPRLGIKAEYVQNGTPLGLEGFVEVHGRNCWVVVAVYQRSSPEAKALGQKAIATATFDGPPCTDSAAAR